MYLLSTETEQKSIFSQIQTDKKYGELLHLGKSKQIEEVNVYDKSLRHKISFLKKHLKSTFYFCQKLIDQDTEEIFYRKFAPSKKGNDTYAYYIRKRFKQIEEFLKDNFIFKELNKNEILTNIFFITLTTQTRTQEQIENSWELMKDKVPLLIRKLRRKFGNISYFYVYESHLRGGCHCHLVLILPSAIKCKKIIGVEGEVKYITQDNIRNDIKNYWEENLDIQGCYAVEGLQRYLAKEMSKQGKSVEQALKNFDEGNFTEKDIKQINTYYYSIKSQTRLLVCSKSISKKEIEVDVIPTAEEIEELLTESPCFNINKSYKVRKNTKLIDQCLIYSESFYTIFSGEIGPGTQEFKEIKAEFDKRSKQIDLPQDIREEFKKLYRKPMEE